MEQGWIVEFHLKDRFTPWLELEPAPKEAMAIAQAVCRVWSDETAAESHADTFRRKFPDKVFQVRALATGELPHHSGP